MHALVHSHLCTAVKVDTCSPCAPVFARHIEGQQEHPAWTCWQHIAPIRRWTVYLTLHGCSNEGFPTRDSEVSHQGPGARHSRSPAR
ncbi:hypothetical protein DUNSADRAFT_18538 [Dunaliella salina]|uniref:Encoded protein n=1 Tax=Dunaliella salina TaxID=3046 RepID=A0ABQ7FZX8_DUNSA|nr:hypothetical protein DUNSADRAFT_18538 [Dunaliella salina]|eukprot:KAF5827910.1 hypothetical protein DUNSADRAFT_18538 [Dunaliella salina]